MSRLPAWLLTHELLVEPKIGNSGTGPRYGPPVTVPCHREAASRSTRDPQGRERDDATVAYCQLDAADVLTLDARVTDRTSGRVVEIVGVNRREMRGPTPNHLEVTFV